MDWEHQYNRYIECLRIPTTYESARCIERLVSHVCSHFPGDAADELDWLADALRDDRKRSFAYAILKKKSPIPLRLAIPLVDAAVKTSDPDGCRWYVIEAVGLVGATAARHRLGRFLKSDGYLDLLGAGYAFSWVPKSPNHELEVEIRDAAVRAFIAHDDLQLRAALLSVGIETSDFPTEHQAYFRAFIGEDSKG